MEEHLNDDELEKLRLENEIKKIKLELEHGAKFSHFEGMQELPPDVEFKFLDYIEKFELASMNSQNTTVKDFVESIHFKPSNEIEDQDLNTEIEKVLEFLFQKGIGVSSLYDVDDRDFYCFITEELLEQEMLNLGVEGMIHQFTYEEFHPNHLEDVKSAAENFCIEFLNNDLLDYSSNMSKAYQDNLALKHFRDAFDVFFLHSFEIEEVQLHEESAVVKYHIEFDGTLEGSHETQLFKGLGTIDLVFQYSYWFVNQCVFPQAI